LRVNFVVFRCNHFSFRRLIDRGGNRTIGAV
jgi:hypothetical protein